MNRKAGWKSRQRAGKVTKLAVNMLAQMADIYRKSAEMDFGRSYREVGL